jgi:beta-phosphoglucomutase
VLRRQFSGNRKFCAPASTLVVKIPPIANLQNVIGKCNDPSEQTTRTKESNDKMERTNEETENIHYKITAETVLFFDMDGTLVDTNLANFLSYKKAINSVTKSDNDLTYNPDKRFNRSLLKIAVPDLTETEYERIIQEKEEYYNDFLHETKLNENVTDILYKYSKTNKTVLVTNCRKERALTTLNHFGLADKFSDIFYRQFADNDKKINKFQNAISILGVPPNIIVAFDNEKSEINDAIKAGIPAENIIHI